MKKVQKENLYFINGIKTLHLFFTLVHKSNNIRIVLNTIS